MLYLIWWTPRCGKSTVSKTLAKKLGVSYFPTDYLAAAIQSKRTPEMELELFGPKRDDDNNRINNDVRFSVFSPAEQIEHYRINAQYSLQGILNIAEYALADNDDLVIEGYHLRPSLIADFLKEHADQVRYILLYKSDQAEIEAGIRKNAHPNDRAVRKTFQPDITYPRIAQFVYEFGQTLKQDTEAHGLASHDMSQWDFFDQIETVVEKMKG